MMYVHAQPNNPAKPPSERSPFATLHRMATTPAAAGFCRVRGTAAALTALAQHLHRSAQLIDRDVVRVVGSSAQPWCDVARQLGVNPVEAAPLLGAAIVQAAGGAMIIVHERHASPFAHAVAHAVAEQLSTAASATQVWLLDEPGLSDVTPVHQLSGRLGHEGARLFLRTMVDVKAREWSSAPLEQLAIGSTSALASSNASGVPAAGLDAPAQRLLARLSLVNRMCPVSWLNELGSAPACEQLRSGGKVLVARGFVQVLTPLQRADADDRQLVVECLKRHAVDCWDVLRAAELLAQDGSAEAWPLMMSALRAAVGREAREDMWQRCELMLQACEAGCQTLLRLGTLAQQLGDMTRAEQFAALANPDGDDTGALLLLAKVSLYHGDFEAAEAAVERATASAGHDASVAGVLVLRAELACARGDIHLGKQRAEQAERLAADEATRLDARNTQGKLLLQQGHYQEAERHFTTDAQRAGLAGLTRAELRARVNRAIARLQSGAAAEAECLLREVLADAQARGIHYAKALALTNLAVVNTRMHRYVAALGDWQQAIDALRRTGDHRHLSHSHLNLAQLRLQVGLVDEAHQALVFARRACPAGAAPTHRAMLSYVAAGVHYQRGESERAQIELRGAMRVASTSSNAERMAECQLLAARIALADGDSDNAMAAAARVASMTTASDALAEAKLLVAYAQRARGEDYLRLAEQAVDEARTHGSRLLQTEARALLAAALFDHARPQQARRHLMAATQLRDGTLAALPPTLRTHFAAKRELLLLREYERRNIDARPSTPTPRLPQASKPARVMVGSSRAMNKLRRLIAKVAVTEATVLITGDSGTGKELVADELHHASRRAAAPFIKVNCGALVETLLLSELFGHEKGAFTGASQRRRGCFEQATGGTLFLDEIGDISPKTQVALLRVLQDKTFQRVGGTTTRRADVRVICATHRDLTQMVQHGSFREDLYYRLCGVTLQVPSLRARIGDLAELSNIILRRAADEQGLPRRSLSAAALALLKKHPWPGNVRELENVLRALALFCETPVIEVADVYKHVSALVTHVTPKAASEAAAERAMAAAPISSVRVLVDADSAYQRLRGSALSLPEMKKKMEIDCLRCALEDTKGNISKAAKILGMKRPRVSQLVHQHGLKVGGAR